MSKIENNIMRKNIEKRASKGGLRLGGRSDGPEVEMTVKRARRYINGF
jgi:hypothetical protein